MLKIISQCPFCPTMTLDTNDVNIGKGVMTQLGFETDSYNIEVIRVPHDCNVQPTGSHSVRINETSEITQQIQLHFLDENKVVGVDWFSQQDCVNLFRFSYGWVKAGLTHPQLKELITRRILHR